MEIKISIIAGLPPNYFFVCTSTVLSCTYYASLSVCLGAELHHRVQNHKLKLKVPFAKRQTFLKSPDKLDICRKLKKNYLK